MTRTSRKSVMVEGPAYGSCSNQPAMSWRRGRGTTRLRASLRANECSACWLSMTSETPPTAHAAW